MARERTLAGSTSSPCSWCSRSPSRSASPSRSVAGIRARGPSRSTGARLARPRSRPSWSWTTSTRCSRPRTPAGARAAALSAPRRTCASRSRTTSAGARSCAGACARTSGLARVLIVGCGCRGRALAAALLADGHAVRGTTRDPARLAEIEAAGVEAVEADPDRLGTLMTQLAGVTLVCWLLGSAEGDNVAELHGPRLETLLERLVDTPVRGIVYEGAGSVDAELLRAGAAAVLRAAERWRMPAQVVETDPAE